MNYRLALVTVVACSLITRSETIAGDAGRPLATVLDKLQHHFLSPITYEEAPVESPWVAFSVTLDSVDSTTYGAADAVLRTYRTSGLPGNYKVVQNDGWVSVSPAQRPVMSSPVTFPVAERKGTETLQLVVDAISRASGVKILLLTVAPEPVPGTTVLRGPRIKPGANKIGPPDSPWFVKKP
jgi:hypothetical protein